MATQALLMQGCSLMQPPDAGPFVFQNNKLDILFVIDNSGSMQSKQLQFLTEFQGFINTLSQGGLPSLHIAVVTTKMGTGPYDIVSCESGGDNGLFQFSNNSNPCDALSDSFIKDIVSGSDRVQNFLGNDLNATFGCIADVGTNGCGFEQPLKSMKTALSTANQGAVFLRDNATLAIIILSDEDDCSASDNTLYHPEDDLLGALTSFRCFEQGVQCTESDLKEQRQIVFPTKAQRI